MLSTPNNINLARATAEIWRAITVIKSRASDHDKSMHEYIISEGTVAVDEPFQGISGVMSRPPRVVDTVAG
jgi:hypothetical protein